MPITQTIPILPSSDFERTARYYALLGFGEQSAYPEYLVLACDGQELHFFLEEGDHTYGHGHSHFSAYLRLAGVDELYQRLKRAGVQVEPPCARPWGQRELELIDPDGTLLRFGEALAE